MDKSDSKSGLNPLVGKALKILDMNERENNETEERYIFYRENLESILSKIGEDKSIAIITVVGPSRKGKSFLLGYMLKYLNNFSNPDWIGWDNPDSPLDVSGFQWRNGMERVTVGIYMWSEPFFLTSSSGTQIAVLVVDTQGVFDVHTNQRDWSTIVGLSLLTSSSLVFNLFSDLQEDSLQTLAMFMRYGLKAKKGGDSQGSEKSQANKETDPECPFQQLVFLIRDWNMPDDCDYGDEGGKKFIKEKFRLRQNQSSDAQRIRCQIEQCFSDVQAFLMPHPGKNAITKNYDGRISLLDPSFVSNLQLFITGFLNPDDLPIKKTNGRKVTAQELLTFFETYAEIFNSAELNEEMILDAKYKIDCTTAMQKSIDFYKKSIKRKLIGPFIAKKLMITLHDDWIDKALQLFHSHRQIGNENIFKEFLTKLNTEIIEIYSDLIVKNNERRNNWAINAKHNALKIYTDSILEYLEKNFVPSVEKLKMFSSKIEKEALETFTDTCGSEDLDLFKPFKDELCANIEKSFNEFNTSNELKRLEAENSNQKAQDNAIDEYKKTISSCLNEVTFFEEEILQSHHESYKNLAIESFKKTEKMGNEEFSKVFEVELIIKLEDLYNEFVEQNKNKREKAETQTSNLVTETVNWYKEEMYKEMLNPIFTIEKFIQINDSKVIEANDRFKNLSLIKDTDLIKKFCLQLDHSLDKTFIEIKEFYEHRQQQIKSSYNQAIEEAKRFYISNMDNRMSEVDFMVDEKLKQADDEVRKEAIKIYNEFPRVGEIENPEYYLIQLNKEFEVVFKKCFELNRIQRENVELHTQTTLIEMKEIFNEEMVKHVKSSRSEVEFFRFRDSTKESVLEKFKNLASIKNPQLLQPFIDELSNQIDRHFGQHLTIFQLTTNQDNKVREDQINMAKKYYNEEMEKRFKATKTNYMPQQLLIQFHEKIKEQILQRFGKQMLAEKLSQNNFDKCIDLDFDKELENELEILYEFYQERSYKNAPVNPAIGIDLGTTCCCVSVYLNGKVHIIENNGRTTTPSYVAFKEGKEFVGYEAKDQSFSNAENTIYDIKRLIGRKFDDYEVQKNIKFWSFPVINVYDLPMIFVPTNVKTGKTEIFYPEEMSAKLLEKMKQVASDYLKFDVKNAVITVPAYFNDAQRQATRNAGKISGLNVLQILNEPTASAVAYGLNRTGDDRRNVLIFDLGGGTFDVAVLVIQKTNIDILAVGGDTQLGGEDFDNNMVNYCVEKFKQTEGINLFAVEDGKRAIRRLKAKCEEKKIMLSSTEEVDIVVDHLHEEIDFKTKMTRENFEKLNNDLFLTTLHHVKEVLEETKLKKEDIDDIVMVGGSTRIPKIKQFVSDFFGKSLNESINPEEAVASGAAIYAAILNGEKSEKFKHLKVKDVAPISLGIQLKNNKFSKIIEKNTKIPISITRDYTTAKRRQTGVEVSVYEGEDESASNNRLLGSFLLTQIPSTFKKQKIPVTFYINPEGILHCTAICVSNGIMSDIVIKENKCIMSSEELERIIENKNNSINESEPLKLTIEDKKLQKDKRLITKLMKKFSNESEPLKLTAEKEKKLQKEKPKLKPKAKKIEIGNPENFEHVEGFSLNRNSVFGLNMVDSNLKLPDITDDSNEDEKTKHFISDCISKVGEIDVTKTENEKLEKPLVPVPLPRKPKRTTTPPPIPTTSISPSDIINPTITDSQISITSKTDIAIPTTTTSLTNVTHIPILSRTPSVADKVKFFQNQKP